MLDEVRAALRTRTRADWLQRFAGDDVCLTEIHTPEEAIADPHARATSPDAGSSPAPALGADTDAVLEHAGIDAGARASLRASGVI